MIEIDVIPLTANRQLRFKNFSDGRRFLLADGDGNPITQYIFCEILTMYIELPLSVMDINGTMGILDINSGQFTPN